MPLSCKIFGLELLFLKEVRNYFVTTINRQRKKRKISVNTHNSSFILAAKERTFISYRNMNMIIITQVKQRG
jgi:hypothetical protein